MKFIFFYMLLVNITYGYINLYPSFFYKQLTKEGAFETFVLTNRSSDKVRYRIYSEEKFLSKLYIEIYPKSIILKPYEKKEVKVLITPRDGLKPGMYEPVMVIKEIEVARGKEKRIYSILKLKLLTYYGDLKTKLLGSVMKSKNSIVIDVVNKGNRVGVFSAYLLNKKRKWEYLDSFILRINEKWKKIYNINQNYNKIKIEEENEGNIFFKNL